jgi:small subunit ribosomal protein S16
MRGLPIFRGMSRRRRRERIADLEKAKAWVVKGAVATDRVNKWLADAGVTKKRVHNNPNKAQPKKKAQERAAAAAKAAEASAEA